MLHIGFALVLLTSSLESPGSKIDRTHAGDCVSLFRKFASTRRPEVERLIAEVTPLAREESEPGELILDFPLLREFRDQLIGDVDEMGAFVEGMILDPSHSRYGDLEFARTMGMQVSSLRQFKDLPTRLWIGEESRVNPQLRIYVILPSIVRAYGKIEESAAKLPFLEEARQLESMSPALGYWMNAHLQAGLGLVRVLESYRTRRGLPEEAVAAMIDSEGGLIDRARYIVLTDQEIDQDSFQIDRVHGILRLVVSRNRSEPTELELRNGVVLPHSGVIAEVGRLFFDRSVSRSLRDEVFTMALKVLKNQFPDEDVLLVSEGNREAAVVYKRRYGFRDVSSFVHLQEKDVYILERASKDFEQDLNAR